MGGKSGRKEGPKEERKGRGKNKEGIRKEEERRRSKEGGEEEQGRKR